MLMRRDSTMALRLSSPPRIWANITTSMWMQSATARVMMTVGADAEGEVSFMPNQPAMPIAVTTDRPITRTVPSVELRQRSSTSIVMMMARYINGISVLISLRLASKNALFIITVPVSFTAMSGFACSKAATTARTSVTISVTSLVTGSGS